MRHSTYIYMHLSIFCMQEIAVAGIRIKLMSVPQKIVCMWLSVIRCQHILILRLLKDSTIAYKCN